MQKLKYKCRQIRYSKHDMTFHSFFLIKTSKLLKIRYNISHISFHITVEISKKNSEINNNTNIFGIKTVFKRVILLNKLIFLMLATNGIIAL